MEISYKPDWEAVFKRDFCKVCENYRICPISYQCHDMVEFIENNEDFDENIHDDNSKNRA